jgi:hypothetical protein
MISPEMLKYIRDATNKSIEKHFKKPEFVREKNNTIALLKDVEPYFFILPFVSLISFLAGYNFCKFKTL